MTGAQILVDVRAKLIETTAVFWTDAELYGHMNTAIKDLWRAISNQHQDYFWARSATVALAADGTSLTSVPNDCTIVLGLEPADRDTYPHINFFPRRYTHPDFSAARAISAVDPTTWGKYFYALTGKGAPGGAGPTISVAPRVSSALTLALIYVPTATTIAAGVENPIPGESDAALTYYTLAHALAKEREDRKPDPDFIALYATEKENILAFTAPRQDDEEEVAEALFEGYTE